MNKETSSPLACEVVGLPIICILYLFSLLKSTCAFILKVYEMFKIQKHISVAHWFR